MAACDRHRARRKPREVWVQCE